MKKLFLLLALTSSVTFANEAVLKCSNGSEWIEISKMKESNSYYLSLFSQSGMGPNHLEASYVYGSNKISFILNDALIEFSSIESLDKDSIFKIIVDSPVGPYSECERK